MYGRHLIRCCWKREEYINKSIRGGGKGNKLPVDSRKLDAFINYTITSWNDYHKSKGITDRVCWVELRLFITSPLSLWERTSLSVSSLCFISHVSLFTLIGQSLTLFPETLSSLFPFVRVKLFLSRHFVSFAEDMSCNSFPLNFDSEFASWMSAIILKDFFMIRFMYLSIHSTLIKSLYFWQRYCEV